MIASTAPRSPALSALATPLTNWSSVYRSNTSLTLSPPTTPGSLVELQHTLGETLDGYLAVTLLDFDADSAAAEFASSDQR